MSDVTISLFFFGKFQCLKRIRQAEAPKSKKAKTVSYKAKNFERPNLLVPEAPSNTLQLGWVGLSRLSSSKYPLDSHSIECKFTKKSKTETSLNNYFEELTQLVVSTFRLDGENM